MVNGPTPESYTPLKQGVNERITNHRKNLDRYPSLPTNPQADAPRPEGRDTVVSEQATDWLVWQIVDSAFPAGSFAHSGGLEAAWQQGELSSCEDLAEFIQVHLAQIGKAALPFMNEAFHGRRPFAELDRLCDAFLSNHVANRGSRAQGQAFLFATSHTFALPSLSDLRASVLNEKLPGHFAPVFGFVVRILGISHALAVRLFLFTSLRTLLASAVRLGIAGPIAAQALQSRLAHDAEQVGLRSAALTLAQVAQTAPLFEVWQGAHDRLYSRLFQT